MYISSSIYIVPLSTKTIIFLRLIVFLFFLQVLIQFCRLVGDSDLPVLELDVLGLGTDIEFRTYDLKASAFLKEFCLKCPEYLCKNFTENKFYCLMLYQSFYYSLFYISTVAITFSDKCHILSQFQNFYLILGNEKEQSRDKMKICFC